MGFLTGNLPAYEPTAVGVPNQAYTDQVDANTAYANRPISEYQNDINNNVREKSNLMGPKNPNDPNNDPNSEAMSARSNQIYQSQVNALMKNSQNAAVARQNQLQYKSLDQQAAEYSNLQSRANINWEQISYQREAAIAQAAIKQQLYAQLFGAVGSIGGAVAAKGVYNARHASPGEIPNSGGSMDTQNFSYNQTSIVPQSYQSQNFGTVGGNN